MNEQTPTAADAFFALAYAHDKLAALMTRYPLGATSRTGVLRSALHATQIELVGGMVCLYRGRKFAGISILFRSLLEATADLLALLNDADMANEFDLRYYKKSVAMMREYLSADTGVPVEMRQAFDELLGEMEPEIDRLRGEGVKPLEAKDRFKAAGLASHYGIYTEVCMAAHNNPGALIQRHLVSGQPNGALEFVFYRDYPSEHFVRHFAVAADLLMCGAEGFHRTQDTGFLPDVLRVREDCGRWMCGLRPEGVKS